MESIHAGRAQTLRRIAFWGTLALTLAAMLLRGVAFFTGYSRELGYFDSTAVTVVYRVLCGLVLLGVGLCACLLPAGQAAAPRIGQRHELIASLPLAARLQLAVFLFADIYDRVRAGTAGSNGLRYVALFLTLLSAVYFLLLLVGRGSRTSRGLCGLIALLPPIGIVALTYGDGYVAVNSPVKLAVQFAAVGIMLALTAELRFLLDKPAPRLALVLSAVAVFLCLGGALPCLVAQLAGVIPATRPEGTGLYQGYLISASLEGVYLLLRFYGLAHTPACASATATDAEPDAESDTAPGEETEPAGGDL